MESLTLIFVALAPSIGALVSIVMMVFGIIRQFKALRADVRDDKTVNEILRSNKQLNAQYRNVIDQVDTLKVELEKVIASNDLTSARIKTVGEDINSLSRKLDTINREV